MDEPPAYTPQALHDLLPIYRPPNATSDHIHTYTLLQTSPSTQILSPVEEDSSTPILPLHIKSFKTGGFMNRKPHIIISSHSQACSPSQATSDRKPLTTQTTTAEARFDIHGTGTSILYHGRTGTSSSTSDDRRTSETSGSSSRRNQRLELEDSRMQILKTSVHGMPSWWQPLPGNRDVLELTNEFEDVIARFVHFPSSTAAGTESEHAQAQTQSQTPPASPRMGDGAERSNSVFSIAGSIAVGGGDVGGNKKSKFRETVVGELHVVDALVGAEEEREEILCSAIVVVERTRRRRAMLESKASAYGVARGVGRNGVAYIPQ